MAVIWRYFTEFGTPNVNVMSIYQALFETKAIVTMAPTALKLLK